jgi:hypothetical protein
MLDVEKFLVALRSNKDLDGKLKPIHLADTVQEEIKIIQAAVENSRREWVGLNHFDRTLSRTTYAPLKPIYHDKDNSVCAEVVSDWDAFFDSIEAKLKEKNT